MIECQAVKERSELIKAIQEVAGGGSTTSFDGTDADWRHGSEKALAVTWAVLHGIVNEYFDGGDQMVENCSCGKHVTAPAYWEPSGPELN